MINDVHSFSDDYRRDAYLRRAFASSLFETFDGTGISFHSYPCTAHCLNAAAYRFLPRRSVAIVAAAREHFCATTV